MRRAFLGLLLIATASLACLGHARADGALPELWGRGLDLTGAQQARARLILTEARAEADDVDGDASLLAADKHARYVAIERKVDVRLYKMLTPPQQDRFRLLHPEVAERLDAPDAVAADAEPRVDGGIGSGPPRVERKPEPTAREDSRDRPTVADGDSPSASPEPAEHPRQRERSSPLPTANRPAISLPLPTFNVYVKMGGIPIPIPISLPPVQLRL